MCVCFKEVKREGFYMEAKNVINTAICKTLSCLAMLGELKGGSNNKTECCEITRGYSVKLARNTHQEVFKWERIQDFLAVV